MCPGLRIAMGSMPEPASPVDFSSLYLAIFPLVLGSVLLSLRFFAYRNLRNVNEVFRNGYRFRKLRSTLTAIMITAVASFAGVQ